MGMKFSCYLIRDLDYPCIARIENFPSWKLYELDHEFNEWGETSNIIFYRAGREFCFSNEFDRTMFIMRWL